MANYIATDFSVNMLAEARFASVRFDRITVSDIPKEIHSLIENAEMANVLSNLLGNNITCNRADVALKDFFEDTLYVAKYKGPKLSKNVTTLPEGASFDFYKVTVDAMLPVVD